MTADDDTPQQTEDADEAIGTSDEARQAATRRTDLRGGLLLLAATALALLAANSPWAGFYDRLLDVHLSVRLGDAGLDKPLLLWINDGLMALFFLLVGLELKRELLVGQLASWRNVALPMSAAIGGIGLPVLIYWVINSDSPDRLAGWAIPSATDIAFALGMLALLGDRVPMALRLFLLTLAVFDDLAAIAIIAVAYTDRISWGAQGLALGVTALMLLANWLRVTRYGVYLLLGAVLWLCVLKSGIHATLAGVVVGCIVPRRPRNALGHEPLDQLEHVLRPWVAFLVLPTFALVNAGVTLRGVGIEVLTHPVTLGVGVGLVGGKLVGVFGAAMLLVRFGWASLAEGTRAVHYLGIAALAGIGFTMSLFIGALAFEHAPRSFDVPIRVGVLGGSTIAALLGIGILAVTLPERRKR